MESKATSRLGIRFVKSGPPELVLALNEIIDRLDRLMPAPSGDVLGSVTPHGTVLRTRAAASRPAAAAAAAVATPFQISDQSVLTGTPVAKIKVNYGWVNDIIPTLGGVSLSLAPLLSLTAGAGTYLIYLDYTYGSACIVSSGLSTTQPADTGSHTYNSLGEVDVIASGGGFIVQAIRNAKVSSLTAQFSSGTQYHWGQQ